MPYGTSINHFEDDYFYGKSEWENNVKLDKNIKDETNNEIIGVPKNNDYETYICGLSNISLINNGYIFDVGNVVCLRYNGKFIYLWQDAKGSISYCFTLFSKDEYSTSSPKLGNVT